MQKHRIRPDPDPQPCLQGFAKKMCFPVLHNLLQLIPRQVIVAKLANFWMNVPGGGVAKYWKFSN